SGRNRFETEYLAQHIISAVMDRGRIRQAEMLERTRPRHLPAVAQVDIARQRVVARHIKRIGKRVARPLRDQSPERALEIWNHSGAGSPRHASQRAREPKRKAITPT